jgi:hypothetical protein
MPFFDGKPRSWESYVAGIRASGLLMASCLVAVVVLIGVITIKTWPHAGDLLPGGGHDASLTSTATPAGQGSAQSSGINLVQLLGANGPAGTSRASGGAGVGTGTGDGMTPNVGGGDLGGSPSQPGSRGGQPQGAQQPSSGSQSPSQPSNAVSETVSGVGNTVQGATTSLGDALGGSSGPGLGRVVGGLGQTLNNTLQGLAGKH